jgi:hypothetical protein
LSNWDDWANLPLQLPSPSTMSRRLATVGVRQLLERVQQIVSEWFPIRICYWIDSKPLLVGGVSKDKDAGYGRAAGHKGRGYRLHVLCNASGAVVSWMLASINRNDVSVANELLENLAMQLQARGRLTLQGYANGDNQYDANNLYERFAAMGLQLVSPPRKNAKGIAHEPQSPHRLRGREMALRGFGANLIEGRRGIERYFANATSFAGGLGPLPAWVRTPHRVAMWVQAKLVIDAIRRAKKQRLAA